MKKRLKEVLAWILSITMLCAICPPMYAAAANGDEIVAYDTEIMVEGNAVSKTGIQLAINKQLEDYSATNPAGAVRLVLNPTDNIVVINNLLSDITYINVPTDKGITSFTITTTKEGATSEDPVKLFVEMGSGANVFANGIPLVVTGPIIVNGDIYGGSDGKDIQKNTSIVYNGATSSMNNRRIGRTSIYGGGLNSTIDGSTYIEIRSSQAAAQSGSGFSVHGGGNATEKEKTANVTGDTNIDLYAPVFVVNGGGYVSDGGTANVFGDTHINILSGADVYKFAWGGGYASNGGTESVTSTANVVGTCYMTIDTDIKQKAYDGDYIIGGGWVNGFYAGDDETSAAFADVGGVDLRINGNVSTNTESNTDRCIIGGGRVEGRNEAKPNEDGSKDVWRANVNGDVTIHIANGKTVNNALFCGGNAANGTSNVLGTVKATIGNNVSLGGIIGGGVVDYLTKYIASADVGQVDITLGDNVVCKKTTGTSSLGRFVGGGWIMPLRYTPENAHANVKNGISTQIGDSFSCAGNFIGGGQAAQKNTTATVGSGTQSATVSTKFSGSGNSLGLNGYYYGAGYASAENSNASVYGNVSTEFSQVQNSNWIWGGGHATASNATAAINGNVCIAIKQSKMLAVTITGGWGVGAAVTGKSQLNIMDSTVDTAYGGGYGGASAQDTEINIDKSTIKVALRGGGWASNVNDVAINAHDSKIPRLCGGGYGASVTQSAVLTITGDTSLLTWAEDNAKLTNGLTVNVGDGATETNAAIAYLYDSDIPTVHVADKAKLVCDDTGNVLFWNTGNLQLDKNGSVALSSDNEKIYGSFAGGGTLLMNAEKQLTIGGKVTGETTVRIDGTITLGQTYITAAADSVGDFVLDSDTFFLKRLQESGKTIWKTAEGVKLTATAGEHGAVSPSGTFTVEKGAEQTFTITPDSGYKIAKVTLDGVDVTDQVSGGRYVLTADQAKALNVTFAKNTQYVTIAATAGSNGSIAPSGMIQVEQDTEKTFTFLPDSGFKVASVTLDGKDVTASVTNNTYTINADTDHTIAVSFEPVVHSVTVTAQAGEHGTVEPAGDIEVEQGTPQSFTFKPDPGYKVDTAWVENDDVTKYLQNNIYTFSPDTDCHLMVTFEKMKAPDLEDKIENLPLLPEDAVPDEVQQESILDTKLDYEAMEEGDKAGIEDETVEKLNDALAKLPEINVKQNIQAAANLPDANMVLQNMVFEEAQAIKQGDISEYNIILEVKPADTLTEFQQTEILKKAESAGVTVGRVHDVTVKKEIIRKNTGDKTVEPLTSLRRQITLVFNVSDLPAPTGVERRWSVLAVHGATGALTTELLYDLDSDPNTVTVQSDKFSLYSLVYQDIEPSHSSGTTYYTITASAGTGGSISPKGSLRVARGGSRTFTITPDTGYEVADVKVDGASVGAVNTYTFDRVTKGHTIVAAFRQAEHDKLPFTDVGASDWFHDSVQYMYGSGLMGGTSDTEFSPQADTTRGMIATILWRLTGKPSVKDTSFTDIPSFAYYADAVAWAAKYGVVKGYDENTFAPDDFITREQLAAMLYRYAGSPTVEQRDMLLAQYHDSGNISRYAVSAVAWTIEQGIITGKGDGILDPKGHATRAETAAILTRYIQKREKIV